MSIAYEWKIVQLEHNQSTGGVIVAHWECIGTHSETQTTNRIYGSMSFEPNPESETFVPYENLTQEIVLGWLWNTEEVEKTKIETKISENIQDLDNPSIVVGLPW